LYNHGLDSRRGVRFDRFGIYGYQDPVDENGVAIDGTAWHPETLDAVRKHSQFALTWDGLYLNLGHARYAKYYRYEDDAFVQEVFDTPKWHAGTANIGKTSDYLFNKWVTDISSQRHGLPYYDPSDTEARIFSKIFSVGGADGDEQLAIYDDGTLVARKVKFTESVEWAKNASPAKTVYGHISLTTPPENNTLTFPENDGDGTESNPYVWHTIVSEEDSVYSHTDNGGATWEGPFLITGRSIDYSETQYCSINQSLAPEDIEEELWENYFPEVLVDGYYVFTRTRDVYNNGQPSAWRYSVGYIGTSNYRISLNNDYASIAVKSQGSDDTSGIDLLLNEKWTAIVEAQVWYGDEEESEGWTFSAVPSRKTNGLKGTVSGNVITISPQTSGKLEGEEHVVAINAKNIQKGIELYTSFSAAKLHPGDDAIGYKVVGYPATIVRHINSGNNFTPDDFVLNALKQVGV
jgi:hypothetical protein